MNVMSRHIHYFLLLILVNVFIKEAFGQNFQQRAVIKEVVSNRQALFNKTKNKSHSCKKLKAEVMLLLQKSNGNVQDLDPLTESEWSKYLKCPETKWENVLERSQIELYKTELMNGVKRLNLELPQTTWAPTRCPCFDAHTYYLGEEYPTLRDYWLIEINNSIDMTIGEYSKIAALFTPIENKDGQIAIDSDTNSYYKNIAKDKELFKHFAYRILGHMLNEPTFEDNSISIGAPHLYLYAEYSSNAVIFALAHELSHVILKHKFASKGLVVSMKDGIKSLPISTFDEGISSADSYKQEFDADSLGLEIMLAVIDSQMEQDKLLNVVNSKKKIFGVFGAEMLLTWMELFQKAEIETYGNYNGSSSHPPALERRNRVRQILLNKGLITIDQDFGQSTYWAMNKMWEKLKPVWQTSFTQIIKVKKKTCE